MHIFLTKGITETDLLWSDVRQGYTWVRRAAHILKKYLVGLEEKLIKERLPS
jgi:hypothetical protein